MTLHLGCEIAICVTICKDTVPVRYNPRCVDAATYQAYTARRSTDDNRVAILNLTDISDSLSEKYWV